MWIIEKQVATQRAKIDGPVRLVTEYRPDPSMGRHVTRAAAVRHLMVGLEPALLGASDEFIATHYRAHARNLRHYRVAKAPSDATPSPPPR